MIEVFTFKIDFSAITFFSQIFREVKVIFTAILVVEEVCEFGLDASIRFTSLRGRF